MTSGRITVSPSLIVALHPPPHPDDPRKLVGWVPGARNRVLVTSVNAVALAELCSGRSDNAPRHRAVRDSVTWDAAMKSLVRSGLCVEGDADRGPFPPFDAPIERLDGDAAPASGPIPGRLKIPWNFAMRPSPEGFLAFSVLCRRYLLLPPEAVAVLVSFVNAADTESACAEDPTMARAWISWLVAKGLLVAAQADHGARVVTSHLADARVACAKQRASLSEEMQRLSATLQSAPPRPAGRTPVYFVAASADPEPRSQTPLALGLILAFARTYEDGFLQRFYDFIPEMLLTPEAVRDAVSRHGPGVVLFSDYIWTLDGHLRISKALKAASPDFVTIHGGPSMPSYEAEAARFFAEHDHIDVAVRGEGEMATAEILKALAPFGQRPSAGIHCLRDITGITFRDPSSATGLTRTADRPRTPDINIFPSAYLSGAFDRCRTEELFAAIIETNRGCPYGCTFCDWGQATLTKIRSFDLDRVRDEIEWIASHHIPVLLCADANFGIFDRDVEIAKMAADARRRHGYPRQFLVNYAKNATARLAEIIRILRDADIAAEGILSMQTTDATTLSIIRRSNIKPKRYDELVDVFRGLKLPVSTDILMGLPGATVDSFARDLQYCIDRGVPARVYPTRVLVNSPMAEPSYREKYRIEVDENDDIVSTFSFTHEDLKTMKAIYEAYRLYEMYGVLFYVLRYLQWDHGIQATDFLRRFVNVVSNDPGAYPALTWVHRYSPWNLNVGGWRPFYEDLARYLADQHQITRSPAVDTAIRAQEALLRDPGRAFPETVPLAHDFAAWWRDHGGGTSRPQGGAPLHTYPPANLEVNDPDGLCRLDLTRQRQYDQHFVRWELQSPLRTADAVPFFLDAV